MPITNPNPIDVADFEVEWPDGTRCRLEDLPDYLEFMPATHKFLCVDLTETI